MIRFFESQSNYLPGDLIVRSQVAELQAYLRKTQGSLSRYESAVGPLRVTGLIMPAWQGSSMVLGATSCYVKRPGN